MNPVARQQITVVSNENVDGRIDLDARPNFLDAETVCLVESLNAGEYQIRLEFSGTTSEQNGSRELAVLFANLRLEASGGQQSMNRIQNKSVAA